MIEPVKLEFKAYPHGSWEDWSKYIIKLPVVSLGVESELEEKHGVIVMDDATIVLKYNPGTAVRNLIPNNFSYGNHYLLRISYYCEGYYYQRFEGIIDIGSITYPNEISVKFKIKDKLAALALTQQTVLRTNNGTLWTRFKGTAKWFNFHFKSNNKIQFYIGASSGLADAVALPANNFIAGEVVELPTTDGKTGLIFIQKVTYWDVTATLTIIPEEGKKFGDNVNIREARIDNYKLFSKNILGKDLYLYNDDGDPEAINGIALIKEYIRTAWSDALIINNSGQSTFSLPLVLFKQFITKPLEKDSLEFLEMLAKRLACYLFFNRLGFFVIQNRTASAVVRSIGTTKVDSNLNKKEFHKRPVDAVAVNLTTHLVDEDGQEIKGEALVKKQNNFEPRNVLKIDNFILSDQTETKAQADEEARVLANQELNYYGLKRSAHPHKLHLDKNTVQWELTDIFTLNGTQYIFTNIKIDFSVNRIELLPVEKLGNDFDGRQLMQSRRSTNANEIKNITIYRPLPKLPTEHIKIVEVENLDITPIANQEELIVNNSQLWYWRDAVNRTVREYSGSGQLKLRWKPLVAEDPYGKFRFAINNKKELWKEQKKYICRAVNLTKEELDEASNYIIFYKIMNTPNELHFSNSCYPANIDFNKWSVLDQIPLNNFKHEDFVEYHLPSSAFLHKYVVFWVGLEIPIKEFKNTYYKFTSYQEDSTIQRISEDAPILPPKYPPNGAHVSLPDQQWIDIIKKRVGSGFLASLHVKELTTTKPVEANTTISDRQGFSKRVVENKDTTSSKKELIELYADRIVCDEFVAGEMQIEKTQAVGADVIFAPAGKIRFIQPGNLGDEDHEMDYE